MSKGISRTPIPFAIRIAAAGLGTAVAGPLGCALGGFVGDALGKPAADLIKKYLEDFGKEAGEKLLDTGADSLARRLEKSAPDLPALYRSALCQSLVQIRSLVDHAYFSWFYNWNTCLQASIPLKLEQIHPNQLDPSKLDDLFRSTLECLDAQGAAIQQNSLSLNLVCRNAPEDLLTQLKVFLPEHFEKNFKTLIVQPENEIAWKQAQREFETTTTKVLQSIKNDTTQIIDNIVELRKRFDNSECKPSILVGTFAPLSRFGPTSERFGVLNNVPDLPRHYLPRPLELAPLKDALLSAGSTSVGLTGKPLQTGLQGMGGIGKSVLAVALARDEEISRAFPDGVIWLTLGQQPNLPARQAQLAEALGEPGRAFADAQQGRAALEKLLKPAACLLVLDDVWELEHAEAFNVMGSAGRIFFTTRNTEVIHALGASPHSLDTLDEAQSLALLAKWAGTTPDELPHVAQEIVRRCGHLPLALAMVGALVRRNPESWSRALRRLCDADLEKIERDFPDYPYPNLLRAIQASVDALPENVRLRYLELAVFPEDTAVPLATLAVYWNMDHDDVIELCETLENRSLARLDAQSRLTLHDLLYDYVVRAAGDPKNLHQHLLNAYQEKCTDGWHTGPNDGYFFDHLCHHMHAAGLDSALEKLLMQFPWLTTRLKNSGTTALLGDYEEVRFPEESEIGVLLSALRMTAPHIHGPADLAGQLHGHLLTRRSPGIQQFLASISIAAPWLRPLNLALRQAGDPLLGKYRPQAEQLAAVTALPDGLRVMSASLNKTVTLLDLESGVEIRTVRDPRTPTGTDEHRNPKTIFRMGEEGGMGGALRRENLPSLFVTPDTRLLVSAFADGAARIWSLANFDMTYGLQGITAVSASADARFLITAENTRLVLRDCASGIVCSTFENAGTDIYLLVSLTDGEHVLAVDYVNHGHELKVFNLKNGCVDLVLPCGHHDDASWVSWSSYDTDYDVGGRYIVYADRSINALAVTADNTYAVSASRDCTLKVWDIRNSAILHTLKGHSGSVNTVAIIPKTVYAVSGSSDKTLKIWNIETGRLLRTFTGHSGEIYDVTVMPDGKRAVSIENELMCVWDLRSREEDQTLMCFQKSLIGRTQELRLRRERWNSYSARPELDNVRSVMLHPDGKRVILINTLTKDTYPAAFNRGPDDIADHSMICELSSGEIRHIRRITDGTIKAVALSLDGTYLFAALANNTLSLSRTDTDDKSDTFGNFSGGITALVWAPDGKRIVIGSSDGTVGSWDVDSRTRIWARDGHDGQPAGPMVVTPDGKQLITASASNLVLWNLDSGIKLCTLRGHSGNVTSVCVTLDGKELISASEDTTLAVWNLQNRQKRLTLRGHDGPVNSVALTPDNRQAVSASNDGTLRVWNLKDGAVRQTLKGHLGAVHAVVVTTDGKHAISAGHVVESSSVLAWNIEADDTSRNLMWHLDSVRAVAIASDGRHAVSASEDRTLKVWDIEQKVATHILRGHCGKVFGVATSPEGQLIISGSGGYEDNTIRIWSMDSGQLIRTIGVHHGIFNSVNAVCLTPNGRQIVSASAYNALKVWDMESAREVLTLDGHASHVNAVAVTPCGDRIVSGSADTTVKVWNARDGRLIFTLAGHSSYVNAVAVTPDGECIVSASADKTLKVWSMREGKELFTLCGHSSYVNSVAAMPGSKYIVSASDDGHLKVWCLDSTKEIANFVAETGLLCCTVGSEGTILAGDDKGWLYVLQLVNGLHKSRKVPALTQSKPLPRT